MAAGFSPYKFLGFGKLLPSIYHNNPTLIQTGLNPGIIDFGTTPTPPAIRQAFPWPAHSCPNRCSQTDVHQIFFPRDSEFCSPRIKQSGIRAGLSPAVRCTSNHRPSFDRREQRRGLRTVPIIQIIYKPTIKPLVITTR